MYVDLNPRLSPGDIFFTTKPDNLFSNLIALETGNHGELTPSHCGIITGLNRGIEALAWEGVVESDLTHYLKDPEILFWTRRPHYTYTGIAETIGIARSYLGADYDWTGLGGFILPDHLEGGPSENPFNTSDAYFCSELVATVLSRHPNQAIARPFKATAPSWWSPQAIHKEESIWLS